MSWEGLMMTVWDARGYVRRVLPKPKKSLLDKPIITDQDLSEVIIKDFLDRNLIVPFAGGYRWTLD